MIDLFEASSSFDHQGWQRAWDGVLAARAQSRQCVALLAGAGFGKTTLLEALGRHFEALGIPVGLCRDGAALRYDVAVLLIDDADRLDDATLRGLAPAFAVLAARPGFADRARSLGAAVVPLEPFSTADVANYLPLRLREARMRVTCFADDVPAALIQASGGAPRLMNNLIGSAALQAAMAGDEAITADHVQAAAADLRPRPQVLRHPSPAPSAAPAERRAVRVALLIPVAAVALLWPRNTQQRAPGPELWVDAAVVTMASPPERATANAGPGPTASLWPAPAGPELGRLSAPSAALPAAPEQPAPPGPPVGPAPATPLPEVARPVPAPPEPLWPSPAGVPPISSIPAPSPETARPIQTTDAAPLPAVEPAPGVEPLVGPAPATNLARPGQVAGAAPATGESQSSDSRRPNVEPPIPAIVPTPVPGAVPSIEAAPRPPTTDPSPAPGPPAAFSPGVIEAAPSASATPQPHHALPDAARSSLVVTHPRRSANAARRATSVAASLAALGWRVGQPFPVSYAPARPLLRYFYAEDAPAAQHLVETLGQSALLPILSPLPPDAPLPRPGTMELALPTSRASKRLAAMLPPAQPAGPPLPSPTLSLPAEGATLAPGETVLRWAAPPRDGGLLELWLLDDAAPPREFFAALVEAEQEQRIALPAGRYAWRVAALSRQGRRYSMSPWSLFTVEKGAP